MSSTEETLAELIDIMREMLTHLKLEEKTILSGVTTLESSFHIHHKDLREKIRSLNLKVNKSIDTSIDDDVEKATLIEQKESLERKIKETTKANKKLINSYSIKPLLAKEPESPPPPKKQLLLDDDE